MQIKLFTIPISDSGELEEEMNRFLRGNKILEIENRLVNNERGASWCFCVKYVKKNQAFSKSKKGKVDYRQELDDETFKVFSKLRSIRKQIASEEGLPAYVIFTDEELANIAKLDEITPSKMLKVKGVGEKKVENYAQNIIDGLKSLS